MRLRWLILIFLLSSLLAGLLLTPVPLLQHWFLPQQASIRLNGAHGIVPRGSAQHVLQGDRVIARNLRWLMRPQDLLLLKAGWQLQFSGPAQGETIARIGPDRHLHLVDGSLRAGASALLAGTALASLPIEGQLEIDYERLVIDSRSQQIVDAAGEARLRGLAWSLGGNALRLGDFRARFESDDAGVLQAEIDSLEGSSIEALGSASLQPDGRYQADIRIRARDGAPDNTRNLLRLIGRPDQDGYYRLRQQGQWRR